jgi:hypothetical protein
LWAVGFVLGVATTCHAQACQSQACHAQGCHAPDYHFQFPVFVAPHPPELPPANRPWPQTERGCSPCRLWQWLCYRPLPVPRECQCHWMSNCACAPELYTYFLGMYGPRSPGLHGGVPVREPVFVGPPADHAEPVSEASAHSLVRVGPHDVSAGTYGSVGTVQEGGARQASATVPVPDVK